MDEAQSQPPDDSTHTDYRARIGNHREIRHLLPKAIEVEHDDRRQFQRSAINQFAEATILDKHLRPTGKPVVVKVNDISEGGLSMTSNVRPKEKYVALTVRLHGKQIECIAEILRVQTLGHFQGSHLMGCRFLQNAPT